MTTTDAHSDAHAEVYAANAYNRIYVRPFDASDPAVVVVPDDAHLRVRYLRTRLHVWIEDPDVDDQFIFQHTLAHPVIDILDETMTRFIGVELDNRGRPTAMVEVTLARVTTTQVATPVEDDRADMPHGGTP